MKVGAIICGAQKAGTTALFEFLSAHAEIGVPKKAVKELHFFDNEDNFSSSSVDYSDYDSCFDVSSETRVLMECTPIYMFWRPAAKRIVEYNNKIKLIIILRDPVERAFSHWKMEYSRGYESQPFQKAIEQELENLKKNSLSQHRIHSYLSRSCYGIQFLWLLQFFEREQILVLRNDQLLNEHEETLDLVCDFLKISHFSTFPKAEIIRPVRVNPAIQSLSLTQVDFLRPFFHDDLQLLKQSTGLNIEEWL